MENFLVIKELRIRYEKQIKVMEKIFLVVIEEKEKKRIKKSNIITGKIWILN